LRTPRSIAPARSSGIDTERHRIDTDIAERQRLRWLALTLPPDHLPCAEPRAARRKERVDAVENKAIDKNKAISTCTAWFLVPRTPRAQRRAMEAAGWTILRHKKHECWQRIIVSPTTVLRRQVLTISSSPSCFCLARRAADLARMDEKARSESG
jgi:hypothetical protein